MSNLYKHPVYKTVYGEPFVTPTGRLAWPALVKPKEAPPAKEGEVQGNPRYEVTLILPNGEPAIDNWITAMGKHCVEMLTLFNEGRKAKIAIDNVLKDGDDFDVEKYPYYKNSQLLVARNVKLPDLVDGGKNIIPAEKFLGGCLVRGTVTPLMTGWGLSYKLEALQLVKDDGVRFAGASRGQSYVDLLPGIDEEEEEESFVEEVQQKKPVGGVKFGKAKALDML